MHGQANGGSPPSAEAAADDGSDAAATVARTYAEIAYPSLPHPRCHPDLMALHARLYGLPAADLDACAVLEVGCGDGSHLIPIAEANPGSRFLGVDVSEEAVVRGMADIAALRLSNITLEVADIRDWSPPPASFDYALAHGVYAWTPPDVREALMACFGKALREGGIALVTYNVAPGCNVRMMMRELLAFELRDVEGAAERMARGREALKEAAVAVADCAGGATGKALATEADLWLRNRPASLIHDLMAPIYAPARLPDVAAHAARHGLGFVGDTDRSDIRRVGFPDDLARRMVELSGGDTVDAEHRHDLRDARAFRHTLLRKGPPAVRKVVGDAIASLHVALTRKLFEQGAPETGEGADGALELKTDEFSALLEGEGAKNLVEHLRGLYPATVPVADLGLDRTGLGFLLMLYGAGGLMLWTRPTGATAQAGERPRARALARLQARTGRPVVRLDHDILELDPVAAALLALCDGRTDLPTLAAALARKTGFAEADILPALPANLDGLARRALILAEDAP